MRPRLPNVRTTRPALVIGLLALAGPVLYLARSWASGPPGFPLDDAWIHQTYARNLAEAGQWAFVPGQPSAGSTAPLWTVLLAVGYALGAPFRAWAYALGSLCLLVMALLAARLARQLFWDGAAPRTGRPAVVEVAVGLACACEWHLVWAAVSGMETLLFALLALALWERVVSDPTRRPWLTGLLGGALILTRPEGALAVGAAMLGVVLAGGAERPWPRRLAAGVFLAASCAVVVAPYLLLNYHLSGTLWPNTFYAKQAEYAVLLTQPLAVRLWRVGTAPLVGGQVLLLPGLAWGARQAVCDGWRYLRSGRSAAERGREGVAPVSRWLPLAWAAVTILVYALRLPVTYQHGRYLIPIIPILIVYGLWGALRLGGWMHGRSLLVRVWFLSTAVLLLAFWLLGAGAYSTDVAIIEGEMVAVARWLDAHVAPDALVAAHDIGALGYFARCPLLDLAGLVSPEVIPFIRDQERLLQWLAEQEADYLVTFPSWYPLLIADPRLEEVYRTDAAVTVAQGGENMAVYALRWDRTR